jgi:hypothetical protein
VKTKKKGEIIKDRDGEREKERKERRLNKLLI